MTDSAPEKDQQLALIETKHEMALMRQQLQTQLQIQELKSSMELQRMQDKLENEKEKAEQLKQQHAENLQHVKEIESLKANQRISINGMPYPSHHAFVGSTILNVGQKQILSSWMPGNWNLVYRASTHGDSSATFHAHCDNIGPTYVIVSVGGYVFGGYASASWNKNNSYLNALGSFLFTLNNPYGDPPTILSLTSNAHAMYSHTSYGPSFGSGFDLRICNSSRASAGNTCNVGSGYANSLSRGKATFTGGNSFTVSDYEVFRQ